MDQFRFGNRGTASDVVNDQLNQPIYRVTGAGENVGLNIRIEVEKESYVAYSKSFYGAKICNYHSLFINNADIKSFVIAHIYIPEILVLFIKVIHDPEDFPQTSVTTSIGQPGFDLTIAVLPSVIVSEPGIRGLSQLQRNCLFEDEVRRSAHKNI